MTATIWAWMFVVLAVGFSFGFRVPRHDHKWKIIQQFKLLDRRDLVDAHSGYKVVLQCEECGNVKAKRL